jgi:DNA invertase Pin-like site-specific DNA recombinase
MKDAISYIRVSSEEQADSGLGLEAQRQRIVAYCTMKGLHLAEVFEDPQISAGKPLASRPAGSRLLAAAKKGKAVVVVAKLDRLFRSVADAANVIANFDKKGIDLVSIAEGFDATTIYGKAMMQVASVFAELERGLIRERTRSAMSVKRSRGGRISGHAPFGWDFVREFPMKSGFGFADYLLYLDRKALGAVEAKAEGTLAGVEAQSAKYAAGLPDNLPAHSRPLPFLFESYSGSFAYRLPSARIRS